MLRKSRRSPLSPERDAARSRQLLLDAALTEFAAKGYAGATVREIAGRAGVNTQLISYYFGGKEGLYNELVASWRQQEARMGSEAGSLADMCVAFLRSIAARPEILKMFVWESLTQPGPRPGVSPVTDDAPEVADLRRRQAAGEIADDLDPRYLIVFFMAAAMSVVTMPEKIQEICGVPAYSKEFFNAFEEQVRRIIRHLSGNQGEAGQPARS